MTNYGDTSYAFIISSAESSSAPSGDVYYFLPKSGKRTRNSQQRKRILRNGKSSKFNTGKRNQDVSISQALLLETDLSNFKILADSSVDTATKVYFWKKNSSGTYEQFKNSSGSYVNYLLCYIESYDNDDYSKMYQVLNIKLTDAWE